MQLHPITDKIKQDLDQAGVWFETFHHQPVTTCQEAAQVRPDYNLHQGAKALILKIYPKGGQPPKFVMLVLPGDKKLDKSWLKARLKIRNFRFANHNEVSQLTNGVLPGGIPPLGRYFNLTTYLDPDLMDNQRIVFNAGDRRLSIAMKLSDYLNFSQAKVLD